jgi:hypothetical protein
MSHFVSPMGRAVGRGLFLGEEPAPSSDSTLDKILAITGQLTETYAKLQAARAQLKAASSGGEASAAQQQIDLMKLQMQQLQEEKAAAEGKPTMPTWVMPVTIGIVGVGVLGVILAIALKPKRKRR